MYISSENTILKNQLSYLVDSLRFALSVSPYSVPFNSNIGVELSRTDSIEDIARYRVDKILAEIDPNGRLSCEGCSVVGDQIRIAIVDTATDTYMGFSTEI